MFKFKLTRMNTFHFGKNLRRIRKEKDLSQEYIANDLNMSQSSYSRMESREKVPDDELVDKLAELLKEPRSKLLAPVKIEPEVPLAKKTEDRIASFLRSPGGILLTVMGSVTVVDVFYGIGRGLATSWSKSAEEQNQAGTITATIALVSILFTVLWLIRKKSKRQ